MLRSASRYLLPLILGLLVPTFGCSPSVSGPDPSLLLEQEAGLHPSDESVTSSPFRLRNQTVQPIRVVGFTTACVESCCARVVFSEAVVIPPGEATEFTAEFRVAATGPFVAPLEVYYDDGKLRTMALPLSGIGRAAP